MRISGRLQKVGRPGLGVDFGDPGQTIADDPVDRIPARVHRDDGSVSGIQENSPINSKLGGVAERLKAPVLKTGTLSKPTKFASKILGFPGLPLPLSRLNRANSGHKNVYSLRRFAIPFPQRFSESFPSLSIRGSSPKRCLKFAGNHSPRYPQNLHSSIHRSDEGQPRSSLPSSTPLDGTTGPLSVVHEPRNRLSELFRFSESTKPDLIWLNQALAQQPGPAESSRDPNRVGPFAIKEGLQGQLDDRNGAERTSAYQFVEFHVLNSRGSCCAAIASEKSQITTPPRSQRDDGIGPFDGYKLGNERNPGTPTFCNRRDSIIRGRSVFSPDLWKRQFRLQQTRSQWQG